MFAPEILNVPPAEEMEHFHAKGFHWLDADAALHARSVIADGETFASFRDCLQPLLAPKGWWGQRLMTDPLTSEQGYEFAELLARGRNRSRMGTGWPKPVSCTPAGSGTSCSRTRRMSGEGLGAEKLAACGRSGYALTRSIPEAAPER